MTVDPPKIEDHRAKYNDDKVHWIMDPVQPIKLSTANQRNYREKDQVTKHPRRGF